MVLPAKADDHFCRVGGLRSEGVGSGPAGCEDMHHVHHAVLGRIVESGVRNLQLIVHAMHSE